MRRVYAGTQPFVMCSYSTLCISYVMKTFLSVSSSASSKQLLRFCAQSRPKKRTKTHKKERCRITYPFPSIDFAFKHSI